MRRKFIIVVMVLLSILFFFSSKMVVAETDNEIIFNDKNLQNALSMYYNYEDTFTKAIANEFSKNKNYISLDNANISNVEGLQYFRYYITIHLSGNCLTNLKPLSMLNSLEMLDVSNNEIKGRNFEVILNNAGRVKNLDTLILNNNDLIEISFLNKIGDMKNYADIRMTNNKIRDISILKEAINLNSLDLSNNRIKDVSYLKNLKNIEYCLDLQDNCILDYRPIKPILDKIDKEGGWDGVISRYDYYNNPVDIGINGKMIKFSYLTAYYKYQAYVEAIPLFKALGGSSKYDKNTGTLTCKYEDNVLVMKDFSKNCTLNSNKVGMKYPMRRMQYDLAYVSVKDICNILQLKYSVTKKREIHETEDKSFYVPKYIEISKQEKELG